MTVDKRFRTLFPQLNDLPEGIRAEVLALTDQPHSYEDIMGVDDGVGGGGGGVEEESNSDRDDDNSDDDDGNNTDDDDDNDDDNNDNNNNHDDSDDNEGKKKSTPQKRKAVETEASDEVIDLVSPPLPPRSPSPTPTPTPPPVSRPREVISIGSSVTSITTNSPPHSVISISSTETQSRKSGPPSTGSIDRRFRELLGDEKQSGQGRRRLDMEGEI